ncbi:hypothetical protein PAPYR_11501 [Paratrimastix pyriformis]|uniref:Uncharacterized protein n=1 Tax=Paratrimastix pyriformis TaxID=342808 RepID=A0ABQ8U7T2_9EUKA|nr:hypothetical protein PAPYR_11501 [Paratrimastix pyriformis]
MLSGSRTVLRHWLGNTSEEVQEAWSRQLGLGPLNANWAEASDHWAKAERDGCWVDVDPDRDGDVPEPARYDLSASFGRKSNFTSRSEPLLAVDCDALNTLYRADARPAFETHNMMNIRQARRLMVMMGLGPLKDIEAFATILFLLCGSDLLDADARWFNALSGKWLSVVEEQWKPDDGDS